MTKDDFQSLYKSFEETNTLEGLKFSDSEGNNFLVTDMIFSGGIHIGYSLKNEAGEKEVSRHDLTDNYNLVS